MAKRPSSRRQGRLASVPWSGSRARAARRPSSEARRHDPAEALAVAPPQAVPLELAGMLRRRRAAQRLNLYAGSQLHIATVRVLALARANDHYPPQLRPLIEAF